MPSSPIEQLPYDLPEGPYSDQKPTASYSALIGQAILRSPAHRLTLQEIYAYISTVYPHYKRNTSDKTWETSIRHVLSTSACFRKVPRPRTQGRTLWAIFDDDVPCFKNGGFNKLLCKDMVDEAKKANAKKPRSGNKRGAEDDGKSGEASSGPPPRKRARRVQKKEERPVDLTTVAPPVASIPPPLPQQQQQQNILPTLPALQFASTSVQPGYVLPAGYNAPTPLPSLFASTTTSTGFYSSASTLR